MVVICFIGQAGFRSIGTTIQPNVPVHMMISNVWTNLKRLDPKTASMDIKFSSMFAAEKTTLHALFHVSHQILPSN